MRPLMYYEMTRGSGRIRTALIVTYEGLFPSVHSQVVVEVVEFSEELIATGNVAF